MAADWLAKSGLKRMCPLGWVACPPSSLRSILCVDASFDAEGIG